MPKKKPSSRDTVLLPKQRMVEADAAEKRLFDDMKQTAKATLQVLKERGAQTYDGVMGSLYGSWPQHFHIEFEYARNQLLNNCPHAQALRHLEEYNQLLKRKFNGIVPFMKCVSTLHYYRGAMKLGEARGLRKLAGIDAAIGFRVRKGHEKREANQDKRHVQAIARREWRKNPNLTIAAIERAASMNSYHRSWKGKHTLRNWIASVDKRDPKRKRGRPKKQNELHD